MNRCVKHEKQRRLKAKETASPILFRECCTMEFGVRSFIAISFGGGGVSRLFPFANNASTLASTALIRRKQSFALAIEEQLVKLIFSLSSFVSIAVDYVFLFFA